MARSDLLVALVRAGSAGDQETLKTTAEALIADERAKNHHILADRLQSSLLPGSEQKVTRSSFHRESEVVGREAIMQVEPQMQMSDLQLPSIVRRSGEQLVAEHLRADVLRAHGYEPRHRILLSGPPGNGKTAFAETIAEALALPLFVVRYDALVTSYLGETNTRLRKLFDYVKTRPCVLFFDEFDAIGKERGDSQETGEIKRVVSFLLLQLDQVPSYTIVVAATNHAELLDRAVWRRFQFRLPFPAPNRKEIEKFLVQVFSGWTTFPKTSLQRISVKLGSISYAEVADFCQNVRRRQILGLGGITVDEAIEEELDLWSSSMEGGLSGKRSEQTTVALKAAASRRPNQRKAKIAT